MNQTANPRVSVVIDSYNASPFIGEAIGSVLGQTRLPDQIVVADASTDDSHKIIDGFASSNPVIQTVFVENRGQLFTILAGLAFASGDIVVLLDGDDRHAPDHVEKIEKQWMNFPGADLIYCRHRLFGDAALIDFLKKREHHENAEWLGPVDLQKPYEYGRSAALAWCHPDYHAGGITSALSFRNSHLQSLPLRELCEATNGQLRANADYMLLLASALYGGRKVYVPDQTVEHRLHPNSVTGRHASGDRDSLAEQRRYCALARSWLCSQPGFGPELYRTLHSERAAVPAISTGHRRLYQQAAHFDPDNTSAARQLQRIQAENLRLKTKLDALETSTFWTASAPFRFVLDKARAARRRLFRSAMAPLQFKNGIVAIDISTIWHHDAGTGIQRVVRKIAVELASAVRSSKKIVLVDYSNGVPLDVTSAFLNAGKTTLAPTKVCGMEILIMLDSSYNLAPSLSQRLREAKRDGVFVVSICHDLLPVTNPEWFLAVNHVPFRHWLNRAADYSNGFLCVSETTATRLRQYLAAKSPTTSPVVASWPLGHDLDSWSAPSAGHLSDGEPFALMVGTVEPRKNHAFVLQTLARLRAEGTQVPRLVVVGRCGWKNKAAKSQLCEAVRAGWAEWHNHGVSDEDLGDLYGRARCVIQASLDEGFGLPVAEAAAMGKPVVLSDIPVFREIVRKNGYFFQLGDTHSFGEALRSACCSGAEPTTTNAVSWRESADIFWQRCIDLQQAARTAEAEN